jgi:hypothetical protein
MDFVEITIPVAARYSGEHRFNGSATETKAYHAVLAALASVGAPDAVYTDALRPAVWTVTVRVYPDGRLEPVSITP